MQQQSPQLLLATAAIAQQKAMHQHHQHLQQNQQLASQAVFRPQGGQSNASISAAIAIQAAEAAEAAKRSKKRKVPDRLPEKVCHFCQTCSDQMMKTGGKDQLSAGCCLSARVPCCQQSCFKSPLPGRPTESASFRCQGSSADARAREKAAAVVCIQRAPAEFVCAWQTTAYRRALCGDPQLDFVCVRAPA